MFSLMGVITPTSSRSVNFRNSCFDFKGSSSLRRSFDLVSLGRTHRTDDWTIWIKFEFWRWTRKWTKNGRPDRMSKAWTVGDISARLKNFILDECTCKNERKEMTKSTQRTFRTDGVILYIILCWSDFVLELGENSILVSYFRLSNRSHC